MDKYYIKIKGIDGPVKVKGFEKCFELSGFTEGSINNRFSTANNGQAFHGVPTIGNANVVISNPSGAVSSKLMKDMLDVAPLDEITVYESTKIKGQETPTYDITYTKAHLLSYQHGVGSAHRDISLSLGAFATIEATFYDIDNAGKTNKFKVKYDLTESKSS